MELRRLDSGDVDLPLFQVSNGTITLTFLPAVGGRLLSLAVEGAELLWRNPSYIDENLHVVRPRSTWRPLDGTFASWANIGGSKTWPAPQGWGGDGEWAGPPDGVIDSGEWTIESQSTGDGIEVTMVSADDARSGIRITRSFTIPAGGRHFDEVAAFTNISARPVTWAVWEVAQVDTSEDAGTANARVEVDVSDERIVDLGNYFGSLEVGHRPGVCVVQIQQVVAKRGFPSATGRIALARDTGAGLELRFAPDPGANYPDQQSRAELWMQSPLDAPVPGLSGLHPDAHLIELEVLGPLVTMQPGESTGLAVRWTV